MRLYQPDGFNPIDYLPPELHKHSDSARYIIHRIIRGRMLKQANEKGFVPLKFDYLAQFIRKDHIKPIKDALEGGVINSDRHFIVGEKSIGYALAPGFIERPVVQVELRGGEVCERVRTARTVTTRRLRLPVHKHLRSWLSRLKLDRDIATTVIGELEKSELLDLWVLEVNGGSSTPTVCPYGRFHSWLTRLPKALRKALTVDGEQLVEIDIVNSQPLMLALIIRLVRKWGEDVFEGVTFGATSDPYRRLGLRTLTGNEPPSPHTPPITTPDSSTKSTQGESDYGLADDENLYMELCQKGRIYEYLLAVSGGSDRGQLKTDFFGAVYGRNRTSSPIYGALEQEFPGVMNVAELLKRGDYRFLPQLMQLVESSVVIEGVVGRLVSGCPEVPVHSIHDSLLTTPKYVSLVESAIRAEFGTMGLCPSLHVRPLRSTSA